MQRAIDLLRRFPALCLTALLHVVLIVLLLHAMPRQGPPRAAEPETQVVFLPLLEPVPNTKQKRVRHARRGGSNAITTYFNPYTFDPQALQSLNPQRRLDLALTSCAPEYYDKETDEVRAACARIRTALAQDQDRFGVKVDFEHGQMWQEELIRRNRPVLAPCMTPGGPDVIYLLTCVYQNLFGEYDSDKAPHY